MYIGFDPGDPTGVCRVNDRGKVIEMSQVALDELTDYLEGQPTVAIKAVVAEKYTQLPHKWRALVNRKTNKLQVAQAEGIIKSWCQRKNLRIHWQSATVLPMGSRHSGITLPKDHSQSHGPAATIHVLEWMYTHGLAKTALELELERERNGTV